VPWPTTTKYEQQSFSHSVSQHDFFGGPATGAKTATAAISEKTAVAHIFWTPQKGFAWRERNSSLLEAPQLTSGEDCTVSLSTLNPLSAHISFQTAALAYKYYARRLGRAAGGQCCNRGNVQFANELDDVI
jgi:hypothetical protein